MCGFMEWFFGKYFLWVNKLLVFVNKLCYSLKWVILNFMFMI